MRIKVIYIHAVKKEITILFLGILTMEVKIVKVLILFGFLFISFVLGFIPIKWIWHFKGKTKDLSDKLPQLFCCWCFSCYMFTAFTCWYTLDYGRAVEGRRDPFRLPSIRVYNGDWFVVYVSNGTAGHDVPGIYRKHRRNWKKSSYSYTRIFFFCNERTDRKRCTQTFFTRITKNLYEYVWIFHWRFETRQYNIEKTQRRSE